jgi:hypothetical protein
MSQVVFVGPDPLPALGSGLAALCADGCGLDPGSGPSWERFELPGSQSSTALLELLQVQERLRGSADAITVWKSSAALEQLAARLGLGLANSPARVARRLENKTYFSRSAAGAGLPVPPTRTGGAGPELLREAGKLPGPWVFQLAQGFSGAQTYPVREAAEMAELMDRFRSRPCRVATAVPGIPITVTGVVGPAGLAVSPACRQLTGIPSLTPHPMGSCGNDYGARAPAAMEVEALSLRVAEWLRQEGHLGIFGLDLVLAPTGQLWCIEVNPRMVASVPLFSLSARDRGGPGLLEQHLACFGLAEWARSGLECHWSQVILYQEGERLERSRARTGRARLDDDDESLGWAPLGLEGPGPGELAIVVQGSSRPGRELARIIFQGHCLGPDGLPLPWISRRVAELRGQLELPPTTPAVS